MQLSQLRFVLILETMKTLVLPDFLCVYVFLNPPPDSVPILYPMKTSVIFKRGTEIEHCLEIGINIFE